jgi:hypothetical protein
MKNLDILNRTILFSQFKKITLSLLLATVLLLLIFLQFQTGQATNQIIFFTDTELSTLGPISNNSAGPEILYPAEFNDEIKQEDVRVVGLANGTLLVAWDIDVEAGSSNVPADHRDLFGKIYNSDGTTVTGDIQLYDYDSIGHSNDVALTPTSDGGFYALWFRSDEIAARKFNSFGIPAGPAQTIISDTVDTHEPEMVELTNGNFMITFRQLVSFPQNNVGTRLYDSALTPLTDIMRTNEMTVSFLIKPNIVPLRNGGSMVSWPAQAGDDAGIFVQVFDANGAKVGGNKQVNTLSVNEQENAQIAPLANGNVVVVYENREIDSSFQSIAGRIINGLGDPVTKEIHINSVKADGFQQSPDVVGLKDNSWVVVWESFGGEEGEAGDGSAAVLAAHFDQFGTAISDEFVVNQTVAKAQDHPFVSAISGTIPVIVWEGVEVIDTNGDDDDDANLLRETDVWMRILYREPVTTTQYTVGKTDMLTNTEVSLAGSEEVLTVTVQISANYEQGADLLGATVTGTVASNFDAVTGTLTLSGSNAAVDYAAAIKTVSFSSTTSADPASSRTVTWSIYGASGLLDSKTMEIVVEQGSKDIYLPLVIR